MKRRAAEEKYRGIFENALEGIFRSTPDGIFRDANPAFAHMLGYDSPKEMMAVLNYQVKPLYLHPEDRQRWISTIEQQDHVTCEAQMCRKDGSTCWIYLSIRAVRDSEGITTYYEWFSTDMTGRKRAEEALNLYATEITDLYEDAPCGYHSLSDDGTILRMNDTALSWLGYARDEVIGKMNITDLLTSEGTASLQRDCALLKKQGWLHNIEDKWIRKNGTVFDVLIDITAVFDEKGHYLINRCSVFDNTERKRAEETLRERVKELNCLYSIAALIEKTDTLEEIFQGTADFLPNSLYYPEHACARITYGELEFRTGNFRETPWKMSADLIGHGKGMGMVEVNYLEEMPLRDEGPYLKEERDLINVIAGRLGKVAERNQYKKDLERLIAELQKALSEINKLSGMLPICASCKKIRNDEGYWEQIEYYIRQHSEAEFSHSICPDCAKKLYPELFKGN